MRVLWLAPLIALFGCAHEQDTTALNASPPPPIVAAPLPPPDKAASAKPAEVACAPIKVHFALDSDQLYDSEKPLLDTTARCLGSNQNQRVTVVGNTDERGSTAYNEDLGQRRADRVAKYLQDKGAAPAQVEAIISHGEESPICEESNLKCWQLNRRTAIRESCHM